MLKGHLQRRGYETLAAAVTANDQEGSFDGDAFQATLSESLTYGRFRLVFVLDQAPVELVRLIRYLASLTNDLVIDLVTVNAYEANGTQLLVPQRVEPERMQREPAVVISQSKPQGWLADGADDFLASIAQALPKHRADLQRLYDWALALQGEGLAKLSTYHGKNGSLTLRPWLLFGNVGLVTIWNDSGSGHSFWRGVFERWAPNSIERIEQVIQHRIGQGNYIKTPSDELLRAVTEAYREAARTDA